MSIVLREVIGDSLALASCAKVNSGTTPQVGDERGGMMSAMSTQEAERGNLQLYVPKLQPRDRASKVIVMAKLICDEARYGGPTPLPVPMGQPGVEEAQPADAFPFETDPRKPIVHGPPEASSDEWPGASGDLEISDEFLDSGLPICPEPNPKDTLALRTIVMKTILRFRPIFFSMYLVATVGSPSACNIKIVSKAKEDVGQIGEDPALKNFIQEMSATQYSQACLSSGVKPPKPIHDKIYWQSTKPVNRNVQHYAAGGTFGHLHTHAEPDNGGCLQLVSDSYENKSPSFAICWSSSGNVCFWETTVPTERIDQPGFLFTELDDSVPYSKSNFNNMCTSCHRGDNPFVGHGFGAPDELGDATFTKFPNAKFANAIVPKHWPQNSEGDKSYQCADGCHVIPKVESNDGFCSTALGMMNEGLMLGKKLKIMGKNSPGAKSEPEPPTLLDEETKLQCQRYANFLQACGQSPSASNLGICFNPKEPDKDSAPPSH